jgi:hypothetical protein
MAATDAQTTFAQYQSIGSDAWPYDVEPQPNGTTIGDIDPGFQEGGYEFAFPADDGEVYAGLLPRAMLESSLDDPDQPFWLGVDQNGDHASIPDDELARHLCITGWSGTGKTTLKHGLAQQVANKGHGFAAIDPGGEVTFRLVRSLPEHRLEDIVYIDPTADYLDEHGRVGFNFLETYHDPGEPGYNKEKSSIVSDLLGVLEAEYPRMAGVAEHLIGALIDASHRDDYQYALIDIYWFLHDSEHRQEYAEYVSENRVNPLLEPFAHQIAELGDQEIEPLLRRLRTWIENDTIRPLIAERDAALSISECIEDGKIILVKCNNDQDLREIVSTVIARKIWSVVTARPMAEERALIDYANELKSQAEGEAEQATADEADQSDIETAEDFDPFYLFIDEAHSVLHENMEIESMLAEARKRKLGVILLTQQFAQIDEISTGMREAIQGNTRKIAYNPGDSKSEKRVVAEGFNGVSVSGNDDDLDIDDYQAWIAPPTNDSSGEGSSPDPYIANILPPVPPVRDERAMSEAIVASVERYGQQPQSAEEIASAAGWSSSSGTTEDASDTIDAIMSDDVRRSKAYKAFLDACIRRERTDDETGGVTLNEVRPRLERYLGFHDGTLLSGDGDANMLGQDLKDALKTEHLVERVVQTNGRKKLRYRPTAKGIRWTFKQGIQKNVGKGWHRRMVAQLYGPLTRLGYHVEFPSQGDEAPDLLATEPTEFPADPRENDARRRTFAVENPVRHALSGGSDLSVEVEKSTSGTSQTVRNCTKAFDNFRATLFVVQEAPGENGPMTGNAETIEATMLDEREPDVPDRVADDLSAWRVAILPDDLPDMPTVTRSNENENDDRPTMPVAYLPTGTTKPLDEISPDAWERESLASALADV